MDNPKLLALPTPWGEKVCEVTLKYEDGRDGKLLTYVFESFKLFDCDLDGTCFFDSDVDAGGKKLREALGQNGYAFLAGILTHPLVAAVRLNTQSFTVLRQTSRRWKEIRQHIKWMFCSIYGFDSLYYEQHN